MVAIARQCELSELLLIVSSECIVDGDYAAGIAKVKEVAANDKLGIIVCEPTNTRPGYNFINRRGNTVFCSPRRGKHSLWDCGIMAVKVDVLLKTLPQSAIENCSKLRIEDGELIADESVEPVSLAKLLHTDQCELVMATFRWTRITDITSFYEYVDKHEKNNLNTIAHNCRDVEIVNTVERRLIVANGLRNVVVVNTRDAVYISDKTHEADIKDIMQKHYADKKNYFDIQPRRYQTWGIEETIYTTNAVVVTKIVVYPQARYEFSCKKNCVANFLVLSGEATLDTGDDETKYVADQNIVARGNSAQSIVNRGKEQLLLLYTLKNNNAPRRSLHKQKYVVKLAPVFKDNLWGGTRIRDLLHKDVGDMSVIAESWELSAHPQGQSRIDGGVYSGMNFTDYLMAIGKEKLGWKAQGYEMFPIMIKFIDAKQNLSIQVHPADEYALSVEGEYGKNEMWHVLEADEDAFLYIGFNRDVTAAELRRRIRNNTLTEVLNRISVRKGDTYFLAAGTVHAIGAGCMICEIQQSSNVTYRLYDYGRKDKTGKRRELHIDRALDVLNMQKSDPQVHEFHQSQVYAGYVKTLIGECKYFTVTQYFVDGECVLPVTDRSFQALVVIEGDGSVSDGVTVRPCGIGDTYFAAAKETVTLTGTMKVLVASV